MKYRLLRGLAIGLSFPFYTVGYACAAVTDMALFVIEWTYKREEER